MAADSKTEKATPKKRRDERKKGNVLLSKDMVAVATLFGSVFMLRILFPSIISSIQALFSFCFSCAGNTSDEDMSQALHTLFLQSMASFGKTAGPLLLITVVVSAGATFAQTKLLVAPEVLKPKLDRISPLQGMKRLFSLRSVVEAIKGILKISVLLSLIYSCLQDLVGACANYLYTDLAAACRHLVQAIFFMMIKVGLAFLVLATLDFLYQWWEYERQLKMSKQEVKEEYKQTEGNPQIKGKIKELQRKMAQSRMMQQVPKADVVIRNPTHFAVALRYKPNEDNAPIVLAKGRDEVALRIVKTAQEHSVAVMENVPLARALYAQAELNHEIPPELYAAVAEVMVYLYQLDQHPPANMPQ
ncbi:MAG: flagellar biosynthesis protein FlhB [Lawsonibacter sp.]